MKYAWLIISIFAARFLATAISYSRVDNDIVWQQWLGRTILSTGKIPRHLGLETFTAVGEPWLPQEWLFSILSWLAHDSFWFIFAGIVALCPILTMFICARIAVKRGATPIAVTIGCALLGIAFFESFGVRAQVVAWPFIAAFLYFIEEDGAQAYFAVLMVAIWSNFHASAMLGPVLGIILTAGSFLDSKFSTYTKRLGIISILSLVAVCINPFGIELPLYALHLFSSPWKSLINEWRPTTISELSFAYGSLPFLLAAVAFGIGGKNAWRDRFIFLATTILMLTAARNVAVFAIIAMPIATMSIVKGIPYFREYKDNETNSTKKIMKYALPAFSLMLTIGVTYGLLISSERTKETDQPIRAIASIKAIKEHKNVFCADFSWCSLLIVTAGKSVFLDSRADPYPIRVWDDFANIIRLKPTWEKVLVKNNVDIVLVSKESALNVGMAHNKRWEKGFSDKKYQVWMHKS